MGGHRRARKCRYEPCAMALPLPKRLGFADRTANGRTDRGVMARTLMYPFAIGGAGALVAAGSANVHAVVRLAASAAICWAAAALLLAVYDALPEWGFTFLCAMGTALLLWTVYSDGDAGQAV